MDNPRMPSNRSNPKSGSYLAEALEVQTLEGNRVKGNSAESRVPVSDPLLYVLRLGVCRLGRSVHSPRAPTCLLKALRRLIEAERECCSFMDFTIEESSDEVRVRRRVPQEMQ